MSFFSIGVQERVDFSKNLSVMLRSGISLNDALSSLGEQAESKRFSEVIYNVRDDIEKGTSFGTALEKEQKIFGPVFVHLVKAGEESGTLEENLYFLSDWFERNADLRREVSSAMLYPKIVFSAALLLGGALAVFILPRLVPLFGQLDVELPLVTKVLLFMALFIQSYWPLVLIALIALSLLAVLLNRIVFIRAVLHRAYLNVPFIGKLLRNYQMALVTQLFGTLLKSGLSLSESVGIVEAAATNVHYQRSLVRIQKNIIEGTTLSRSLKDYPMLYPRMLINITEVGEQSGTLSDSFVYLAEYYTKEVNAATKKLPTIIEPLLLIVIAVMVGFVALAIILPIYKLTGSITR